MIIEKLNENWDKIARIGIEAEERGRTVGVRPSWVDPPKSEPDLAHLEFWIMQTQDRTGRANR